MSENPSDEPTFGGDSDRIMCAVEALDWSHHPDPQYQGELEMQVAEYECQIWDQILAEDNPPPATVERPDFKTFNCTFCAQVQHFTTENKGYHADNCPTRYMAEEMQDNTNCFKCGGATQPEGGVRFFSVGEYGSTVFDSDHDREYLLLFLCDQCVCRGQRKILHWESGRKTYQEFDPGPQHRVKLPSVTLRVGDDGKVHVSRSFGSLSGKGMVEEAQTLRGALQDAVTALDATIETKSRSVDETIRDMNAQQSKLSESIRETLQALRPALDQDNITSFSFADIPKIQDRVAEIENEEKN